MTSDQADGTLFESPTVDDETSGGHTQTGVRRCVAVCGQRTGDIVSVARMRYIFLALTNPADGREDEFNAWYDEHHIPEVVRYGRGFLGGRRYRLCEVPGVGDPAPWRYLAYYDMESDDLAAYHRAPWTETKPPLTPFTGLLNEDHVAWIYCPLGAWVNRRDTDDLAQSGRSSHLYFALTNATPGGDVAFRDWHETHVREVVTTMPGLVAGRRYARAEHQRPDQPRPAWTYLTTYALERDGIPGLHVALADAARTEQLTAPPPDAITDRAAWVYAAISDYYARR